CALQRFGAGPGITPVLSGNIALLPALGLVRAVDVGACGLAWERANVWLLDAADGVAWVWHGDPNMSEAAGHLYWLDLRTGAVVLHRTVIFRPSVPAPDGAALRTPLYVERRGDRLLLAARCTPNEGQSCPTWVGAFDRA